MNVDFQSFEVIKSVINTNNVKIEKYTDLTLLYLGFCQHFMAYIDAYKTLFLQENYYSCQAIDRILFDLYLKIRFFNEIENPADLADWLWDGKNFSNYKGSIIKNPTDTEICRYFDELDENKNKMREILEERYRKASNFVHPSKQAALEYWSQNKWGNDNKKMLSKIAKDNAHKFIELSGKVGLELSELCCKINQNIQKNVKP